jgi:PII-like signaling protein
MQFEGKGKILRIYLNANAHHEGGLLYEAIVRKAFEMGLAGSMVFNGIEGFGFCCPQCRTIHTGMTVSPCQPMVIEFIDREEKIRELAPVVKQMLKTGAMIVQDVEIEFNRFQ